MKAHFIIPGEPKAKGRPRFSMMRGKGGEQFVRVHTPDKTVVYENLIRLEYERQCGGVFFQKGIPLRLEITAYYGIPKSVSKKKAAKMAAGKLLPLKKPDLSNVQKAVEDALNGVAYHDDVQLADTRTVRYYGEVPRVEVVISEIEGVDDG